MARYQTKLTKKEIKKKKIRKKNKNDKTLSLKQRYFNPNLPGSFGGVQSLKRHANSKLSLEEIKNWLGEQDTYTLHKPVKRKFPRRKIIVSGIDAMWQSDLIDCQNIKKENDNFGYLLVCIDVFSKFAWVIPLKNKTSSEICRGFTEIFSSKRKCKKICTDKGSEFYNTVVQKFFKSHKIKHFSTENNDIKASIAERFIRTLKEKIYRYFTFYRKKRFVEVLPSLVSSYNKTYHRSIKRAPIEVTYKNSEDVWQILYGDKDTTVKKEKKPVLKLGDRVRISKTRRNFKKSYLPGWTEELYTVSQILDNFSPITYRIKDDHNEEIAGSFYHDELQKVAHKEVYNIEKVLKTRCNGKEYLVRWSGYPPSFDSWIPASDIKQF